MYQLTRDDLQENVAVIKINKSYREDLTELELYDVTRGMWKRKIDSVSKAEYVLSVAYGEVKEVYKIDKWLPAPELNRKTIPYNEELEGDRIGFAGEVAADDIRSKYIGKSVAGLYKKGEADPVKVFLISDTKTNNIKDINIAIKPTSISLKGNEYIVACPNCSNEFIKAPRCPECGQLIKY